MVKQRSKVVTDEWNGNKGLNKNFTHVVLGHKADEFINANILLHKILKVFGVSSNAEFMVSNAK